jgi:amidohydrolase
MDSIKQTLLDGMTDVIGWRRMLHQHPELSHREYRTAAFVSEQLTSYGIEVKTGCGAWDGGPGAVVGLLRGGHPGPTVALRADMDALPMQDEKEVPYRSQVAGVMHACGHDAHTANLLGVARALGAHREQLHGNVKFIFQHAEETHPGGAKFLVDEGVLDDVDVIYGVHLWSLFPLGEVHCSGGAVMATAEEFVIRVQGKGGHAAQPHLCVDALLIGAQMALNLQTIVSRSIDPIESCVVTVGSIHAGSSFNVIADTCEIKGTVRTFNEAERDVAERRLREIAEHTAAMHGATAEVLYKGGFCSVINDRDEAARCRKVSAEWFGVEKSKPLKPIMAGEDFAFYLQERPGCFMFVGARNEQTGCHFEHHHPKFDLDERSFEYAALLLIGMTLDYMDEYRRRHA